MGFREDAFKETAKGIIKNLERRNMAGYYCATSADAVELALSLMPKGSVIGWGGSETIKDCGLMKAISSGDYDVIDRTQAKNPREAREIYAKIVMSDFFLMSTNAITLDGELVNIDGLGNRTSALIYGPEQVIIIAGMNKVTANVQAAYDRIKVMACPPNAKRLGRNMPCAITGRCGDCYSDDCFCNQLVVTRRAAVPKRIKVILVGEDLGY